MLALYVPQSRNAATLVLVFAFVVPAASSAASRTSPVVTVLPAAVQLHEAAMVSVRAVGAAAAVDVRLRGASMPSGTLLPWTHLRAVRGAWSGRLGRPALRGVYPLELRLRPGGSRFVSDGWLLRVVAPGTLNRPAFTTPEEVVQWWVTAVAHGSLVGIRSWPLLANDRRDPRLHRLYVVAYDPPGTTDARGRLGVWITAFRDGYHGEWRLLEATVQP